MTFWSVSLALACMVAGGFIGIYRLSILLVIGLSGFLSFAAYNAFHPTLSEAIELFGVEQGNAVVISLCLLVLVPLFGGMYTGSKVVGFLGLKELADSGYSSRPSPADKIFGSGFALLVYLVIFTLYFR